MKLTLKCLIDFRSWLGENHNIWLARFEELPEFVQNAYYMEFFKVTDKEEQEFLIKVNNIDYNNNFQKELDENNR